MLLWQQALARLQGEASDSLYQSIFQMGTCKGIDDDKIVIAVPFPYLTRLFGRDELALLDRLFSELAGRPLRTQLIVEPQEKDQFARFAGEKRGLISQRKEQFLPEAPATATSRPTTLNESFTLAGFVVRDSTQLAVAA
ncbi:MAG: hypothetical protein ABI743_07960, partial [bacterium]